MSNLFTVDPLFDGERLDLWLVRVGGAVSRSRAQELIRGGRVRCDGEVICKSGFKVRRGQRVAVEPLPERARDALIPESHPLEILYQDDDIVVVNKVQGLCVHAGAGNPHGTLVERVLGQGIRLSSIGLPLRPGIVHRLDKGTSGVMVLAKTDRAHLELTRQFANRMVKKIYLALVIGKVPVCAKTIHTHLGRHPRHRKKFASVTRHGKEAVTHVRVLGHMGPFTFVEARIKTGRTHQIRVHLSEWGHPIVGDAVYGGGKRRLLACARSKPLQSQVLAMEYPLLHAYSLAFLHPVMQTTLAFTAPLPDYFSPFVDSAWLGSV